MFYSLLTYFAMIGMRSQKEKLCIGIILCIVLCIALAFTGCTSSTPGQGTTSTPTTGVPVTTSPAVTTQAPQKTLIAFTAASLSGASNKLGPAFSNVSQGYTVKFNLDGTQVLKQQIEQGANADVFISASNSYTNGLKNEGYLINNTVRNLTSNYIIVIIPAGNPGNITSLADLGTPGKRIAMGTPEVPVGNVTRQVINKLANSTYNSTWQTNLYNNVKTLETTEPGVVTKVSLGEVDAGFVYESSYKAAPPGTLNAISIPVKDNVLQIYTIGVLNSSTNQAAAQNFEDFMVSSAGQKILSDFGFRPYGS